MEWGGRQGNRVMFLVLGTTKNGKIGCVWRLFCLATLSPAWITRGRPLWN